MAGKLYVFTASNQAAKDHIRDTIDNPISPEKVEKFFSGPELIQLQDIGKNQGYYAWGATPGPKNKTTWESMSSGDYVLVYQDGTYTYYSKVVYKVHHREMAVGFWGTDPEGNTWEYIYFLEKPYKLLKPVEADRLSASLQSKFMGFTCITEGKVKNIIDKFGSIDAFFGSLEKYGDVNAYLLIRSNEMSQWKDKEGKSYSYGNTVPNYTKIVPGAKFLLDRRTPIGKKIIAKGIFSNIHEDPVREEGKKLFHQSIGYTN